MCVLGGWKWEDWGGFYFKRIKCSDSLLFIMCTFLEENTHFFSFLHHFCLTADAAAGGHNGCVPWWLLGTQHGISGYTDPPSGGDQHERPAAHSHDSSVRSVRVTATQIHLGPKPSWPLRHTVITAMLMP